MKSLRRAVPVGSVDGADEGLEGARRGCGRACGPPATLFAAPEDDVFAEAEPVRNYAPGSCPRTMSARMRVRSPSPACGN